MTRIAPIFPVRDVATALEYYGRLGFDTRAHESGGYGFVNLDGVEIHVGVVPDGGSLRGNAAAYLYVDDADELADSWRAAGGDVHPPEDTEWGQHEGVLIDPDGNIIRFGSPMTP
jgi:predicted enzyme related to lactoylglutathione lyase